VEKFKYLGAIIAKNGDCGKKIHVRLGIARGADSEIILDSLWKDLRQVLTCQSETNICVSMSVGSGTIWV